MKWVYTIVFLFLSGISYQVWGIDTAIKAKFPDVLLTPDDYGILNEKDLAAYTVGVKREPFSILESRGTIYWQCFPREDVSISLEDIGYSSEDIGWKENYGELKITVTEKKGVIQEYELRSLMEVSESKKNFNRWQAIMRKEKYVCIAGSFVSREKRIEEGGTIEVYGWIFDKIKTKKGCDEYFNYVCK